MANELKKIEETVKSQLSKTDKVIASNEAISELVSGLDNRLSEMHGTLTSGFSMLGTGLQELCFSIDDGFREISYKLDLQNETLQAIKEILEKPLDTQAKELRKRAEFAYLNGWMDEAEVDLLESEKKNYQDFIALHILGNIYYHHKKDNQKALEYYQKAAKYAAPQSKQDACKALLCTAKVYKEIGKVEDAYKSTRFAMGILPDDAHNLYNHAAYAAMTRHADESINCLRQAALKDSTFLITADSDERFSNVEQQKEKLKKDLRDGQRKVVDTWKQKIVFAKKEAEACGITDFSSLIRKSGEIEELYNRNSYLDLLKAEHIAQKAYEINIEEWIKVKEKAITALKGLENDTKTASIWGWTVGLLSLVVGSPIITIAIEPLFGEQSLINVMGVLLGLVAYIGVWVSGPIVYYFLKSRHRYSIRSKIEKENNAIIARLSSLKKMKKKNNV